MTQSTYERLRREVIAPGLCTGCGLCAGLSRGTLTMVETPDGPLPTPSGAPDLPPIAYDACPGRGVDYPALFAHFFPDQASHPLIGPHRRVHIAYAADPAVRRAGASGGVITAALCHLLDTGQIDGAVVVRQGSPRPWDAEPVIARTADEIRASSGSVYRPVPVNTILDRIAAFDGRLAYVGLPDAVAALRALQAAGHPAAAKVVFVLGPYTGTNMVFAAIRSFLRSHGVHRIEDVTALRYRDGEWPGYLSIHLRDGRELRAEKFYYNYLIPFYITRATLFSVDFANELTDLSVGDAWNPRYEAARGGYSVVVARTAAGEALLDAMQAAGRLMLEPVALDDALAMHGHMIDFKKRGAFIRMGWRRRLGRPVPDYGFRPRRIPLSRVAVEVVVSGLFAVCGTWPARRLVERVPLRILGPLFDTLRKSWKSASKPVKRRGLRDLEFVPTGQPDNQRETPMHPSLMTRVRQEIGHWLRRRWTFADVGAHWDATEDYDDINEETYSYFRRFTDGHRLSSLTPNGHVLDLCARTGNGTLYFYQQGKIATAVCADVSRKMGDICRRRLTENGFYDFTWMYLADDRLPFRDGEFDSVLCFETVEHVSEPERLVAELGRVTRPGGQMILTTPSLLWEPVHALAAITGLHHSEGPHRFLRLARLRRMVEAAGFEITALETTVLIPGGPKPVVRLGEWIERRTRDTLMPHLGLRRVLVCVKR